MGAGSEVSQRLDRLEQILSSATPAKVRTDPAGEDPVPHHLNSVPLERIRQLTAELERTDKSRVDEVDALTMRLLLADYVAAVGHLRSIARLAESRMTAILTPISEAKRMLKRVTKPMVRREAGDPGEPSAQSGG